jgi:hypothetical protein
MDLSVIMTKAITYYFYPFNYYFTNTHKAVEMIVFNDQRVKLARIGETIETRDSAKECHFSLEKCLQYCIFATAQIARSGSFFIEVGFSPSFLWAGICHQYDANMAPLWTYTASMRCLCHLTNLRVGVVEIMEQIQEEPVNSQSSASNKFPGNKRSVIILLCFIIPFGLIPFGIGIAYFFVPGFKDTAMFIITALQVPSSAINLFSLEKVGTRLWSSVKPQGLRQEGPILIVYSSHDPLWPGTVKTYLEQLDCKVLLLLELRSNFREDLRQTQRKAKRIVTILSLETLALFEQDPKWFHKWKRQNRKRKNAVICVRNEVYQKLLIYDKKLQLLNFKDDADGFIGEEKSKSLINFWIFRDYSGGDSSESCSQAG